MTAVLLNLHTKASPNLVLTSLPTILPSIISDMPLINSSITMVLTGFASWPDKMVLNLSE